MKYLIVSSLFAPESRGGAEVVAERYAQILASAGNEVVVATLSRSGAARFCAFHHDYYNIYRCNPWGKFTFFDLPRLPRLMRPLWHILDAINLLSARQFKKILAIEKPDAVVFHNIKGFGYLLPRVARKFGAKTILVLHDVQLIEPSGIAEPELRSNMTRRLWSFFSRRVISNPHAVVYPSEWLLVTMRRFGFFKRSVNTVIRNPASKAGFLPARPIKNLLYLGQLESAKGVRFLFEVIKMIRGDFILNVVGSGSLKHEIERIAKLNSRVKFYGRREGNDLEAIWRETDLLLVPSIAAENAPTVLQEAVVRGLMALASSSGGIPELVSDGGSGYLLPVGDASAWSEKINALLGTSMSAVTREKCRVLTQDWSEQVFLKKFTDLVNRL
jgi:glycosyltransferase involved in cell wall biosynthesis